ncbi:MAG: peptidase S8, partial [Cytophagaceae bacterium]
MLRYQQTGDTLLVQKLTGQSPCTNTGTGLYRLIYSNNGENVSLQVISDDCPQRQHYLTPGASFIRQRSSLSQPPRNWPYLDPKADSIAGISLYQAYDLLKNRTSVPVIVGVLDSGVDITHEDLRDVIWVNPAERPDNQIDDDKNGYTDDLNGWNFMGAKDGTTYEYDQPEITQTYVLLRNKYDKANPAALSPSEKRQYNTYQTAKKQFLKRYAVDQPKRIAFADTVKFWTVARQIATKLPDSTTSQAAIRQVDLGTDSVSMAVRTILADGYFPQYGPFSYYTLLVRRNWARFRQIMGSEATIGYNPDYNARTSVGDNPANPTERYYGSPRMIIGESQQLAMHGSHVAGIIAA